MRNYWLKKVQIVIKEWKPLKMIPVLLLTAALLAGCAATAPAAPAETVLSTSVSTDSSHSSDAQADYDIVFPQETVNRIDITLDLKAWDALQAEMMEQFGEPGTGQEFSKGGFPPGGQFPRGQAQPGAAPDQQQPPTGALPPQGFDPGQIPADRPEGGMRAMDFGDTSYVKSTVTFNGETWGSVGFRYSGNSTLQQSWRAGTNKISFRLDFDEFEDETPAIKDQRFYGFKQISFKSNAMDSSYIREKVVADMFRDFGVVSSQTAFYEVYLDYGEGPQYFGLYTAVEIVDDTVIQTQFSDDSGNVYKPDGSGAAFVEGTFDEASFEKQTNKDEADWSDIEAVFSALHSDLRNSDPAAWRAGLETVFDVQAYLRWLALDTIIQNWDTYGSMAHNYYLYTDPQDGMVTWIPWDNNMALSAKTGGGDRDRAVPEGGRGGPGGGARELDLAAVGKQWPLIRYLADDPVYLADYQQYLEEAVKTVFQPEVLAETYQSYHDLIAPYVLAEEEGFTQLESVESFDSAVEELKTHAKERYNAVLEYLEAQQ